MPPAAPQLPASTAAGAGRAGARSRRWMLVVAAALLLAAAMLVSMSFGAAHLPVVDVLRALTGGDAPPAARDIVVSVRAPRVVLAALVGAVLSMSGAAIQGLFKNPLAEPGLVGVSAGGSLGAALAIVVLGPLFAIAPAWLRPLVLPLAAFAGSAAVTRLILRVGSRAGQTSVVVMLLAGIAINAFAGAVIGLAAYFASDRELRDLVFWMLGSLAAATPRSVACAAPPMLLSLLLLPRFGAALNLLALGDKEARRLGVGVEPTKRWLVMLVALGVGASASVAGLLGFVGLCVPHLVRIALGPDHRSLLVMSALLGATLLVLADTLARTLVAPLELPLGVLTALVGAPTFLYLLLRDRSVAS